MSGPITEAELRIMDGDPADRIDTGRLIAEVRRQRALIAALGTSRAEQMRMLEAEARAIREEKDAMPTPPQHSASEELRFTVNWSGPAKRINRV